MVSWKNGSCACGYSAIFWTDLPLYMTPAGEPAPLTTWYMVLFALSKLWLEEHHLMAWRYRAQSKRPPAMLRIAQSLITPLFRFAPFLGASGRIELP